MGLPSPVLAVLATKTPPREGVTSVYPPRWPCAPTYSMRKPVLMAAGWEGLSATHLPEGIARAAHTASSPMRLSLISLQLCSARVATFDDAKIALMAARGRDPYATDGPTETAAKGPAAPSHTRRPRERPGPAPRL